MNMTQPNGRSGTYRVPQSRIGELRLVGGDLFGDLPDRLGKFEALELDPEQLKVIVERYRNYEHLFQKI